MLVGHRFRVPGSINTSIWRVALLPPYNNECRSVLTISKTIYSRISGETGRFLSLECGDEFPEAVMKQ